MSAGMTCRRTEIAADAAAEISAVSQMLLDHLRTNESPAGEALLLFRGPLMRFQRLSEIILECAGQGDDWTEQQMAEMVGVARPSVARAASALAAAASLQAPRTRRMVDIVNLVAACASSILAKRDLTAMEFIASQSPKARR